MAESHEMTEKLIEELNREGEYTTIEAIKILQHEHYDVDKAEPKIIESFLQRKFKQIQEQLKIFHQAKEERIRIVESDDYLKRLTIEFGGDREKARGVRNRMLKNLKESEFYISNFPLRVDDENTIGRSDIFGDIILGNEVGYFTALHELSHHSTENGTLIPNSTKRKLTKLSVFEKHMTPEEQEAERIFKEEKGRSYYIDADEILARKVCLDMELEKLHIKKYGEPFTKKHYEKIKKLKEEGKLQNDADQFFRMFKRDTLIMIMNTVAFQEYLRTGKLDRERLLKELEIAILNTQGDSYYPPEFWVHSKGDTA